MIDLDRAGSLGEALHAALLEWSDETYLIEADRNRETARYTYREFREHALPLAAFLLEKGFEAGDRVAIVLSNQSRWHLWAYAVFHAGGVLVPLDFKLTGEEHLALLAHCRAKGLVVEHHLWEAMRRAEGFDRLALELVMVIGAPPGVDSAGAERSFEVRRGETCRGKNPDPPLSRRARDDVACIVYSSGTGGRAKGCLLTHGNYLAQLEALTRLHPFGPGVRYLSILPTNHAIDFMVGFVGPFLRGATVVHLRTLRPELVRDAFVRYRITHMALVPVVLENLAAGIRRRLDALSPPRRAAFRALVKLLRVLSRGRPNPRIARLLLRPVHDAFGGNLTALFVGGAATNPATLRFFHDLGIPVANGYGLTEAGTAITLDRLDPPRPDTVGKPLPGIEVEILDPDADGVGEVAVRGPTVMAGYLDDPDLTRETIAGGWLRTGDLGRLEDDGNLRLFGRKKNMIVTAGGKNVYPEDVEGAFEGIGAKELCVFAAHYLWPDRTDPDERLVLVARAGNGDAAALCRKVAKRNRGLLEFQRVHGVVLWEEDFPRTASLKIKRGDLARRIGQSRSREADVLDIP